MLPEYVIVVASIIAGMVTPHTNTAIIYPPSRAECMRFVSTVELSNEPEKVAVCWNVRTGEIVAVSAGTPKEQKP